MVLFKKIAARLPDRWQTELKRSYFARQIRRGHFLTDEPEYSILDRLIHPGDWVIDIGANVGHYTKRFSEIVGPDGRVIAFEPVPKTFSLLSANAQLFAHANVTLINAAVSDKFDVVGMALPTFPTGLANYYEAHIPTTAGSDFSVLTMSLDSLCIDQHHISLVKIDVEGHESFVLEGMKKLIKKWHPILIIETDSQDMVDDLQTLEYSPEKLQNSPNVLFKPIL